MYISKQKQNGIYIDHQPKRRITNKDQRLSIVEETKKKLGVGTNANIQHDGHNKKKEKLIDKKVFPTLRNRYVFCFFLTFMFMSSFYDIFL